MVLIVLSVTIMVASPLRADKRKTSSQGRLKPNMPKRKRKDKFPSFLDPKYFWTLRKVVSYPFELTYKELVEELVSSFAICSNNLSKFIVVEPCNADDRVYMKSNLNGEDFIFVSEFNVFFSFVPF